VTVRCVALLAMLAVACDGARPLTPPPPNCTTCVLIDGSPAPAGPTNAAVFVDAPTARFFNRLNRAAFWLFVALSPIGWLVIAGVRWLAGKLHAARRAD
jgi:hypothetical protein